MTTKDVGIAGRLKLAMGGQIGVAIKLLDEGVKLVKVDDLTQRMRIATCEGCPRFVSDVRQCLECSCKMDYKTSLYENPIKKMSGETDPEELKIKCPLGKWH